MRIVRKIVGVFWIARLALLGATVVLCAGVILVLQLRMAGELTWVARLLTSASILLTALIVGVLSGAPESLRYRGLVALADRSLMLVRRTVRIIAFTLPALVVAIVAVAARWSETARGLTAHARARPDLVMGTIGVLVGLFGILVAVFGIDVWRTPQHLRRLPLLFRIRHRVLKNDPLALEIIARDYERRQKALTGEDRSARSD